MKVKKESVIIVLYVIDSYLTNYVTLRNSLC